MPLIDRLKHLEGYIKAILALIALLPGIATIVNILPIPAQISTLVGFLFGFAGIAIVLMVAILSKPINRLRPEVAALALVLMLVGGMASAIGYVVFAERFVVTVKHPASSEQVLVPLVLDKNLTDAMAAYHGELEETLNSSTRNRQLIDSMNRNNGGTEALMIVLLLLAQSLLVGSIAFAAWRASQDET